MDTDLSPSPVKPKTKRARKPPVVKAVRTDEVNMVYRFGCRAPRELALAEQMLGQAWLYREDLRHVYNAHARATNAMWLAQLEAEHVKAFERYEACCDEVGHVHLFHRVRAAAERHGALNEAIRAARAKRGHLLDAGTYWLIEKAILAASAACKNKACKVQPCSRWACTLHPIAKQPFDCTGTIGAQIQSTTQFAAGASATVPFSARRFEQLPAPELRHRRVTLVPDGRYHVLTIHVGDVADGHSISWPCKLHRPFPPGAIVKQVAVQRVRVGHRFSWEALVTVAYVPEMRDVDAKGVVGIDIGWRDEGERGMRIATHNAEGETSALLIDTRAALEYADAVRGHRDDAFNAAKEFAATQGIPGAEHVREWRDKSRLLRLAVRTQNFGLLWWRLRDRHLEDIECGVREKALQRRLEHVRAYVDSLAKRFEFVVLEDMYMSTWVCEGETADRERNRSIAALSVLQDAVLHRFGKSRVHWAPAEYTTMTCAKCGTVRDEAVGPAARWVCAACGFEHHQDENAAEVLRKLGERWIGDGNPPRARSPRISQEKKKKEPKPVKIPKAKKPRTRKESRTAREPISEAAE